MFVLLAQSDPAAAGLGIAAILGLLCLGVFSVFLTFLPAIIAVSRGHPNAGAITVLTLLLGWTGIAWIIALVWAFTNPSQGGTTVVIRERGKRRRRSRDYDDEEDDD